MPLNPPKPNIEAAPNAPLDEKRLRQFMRDMQRFQDYLSALFPLRGGNLGLKYAAGETSLSFSASTLSAIREVSHGLGTEPDNVLFTPVSSPDSSRIPKSNLLTTSGTSFSFNGSINASHTGNITVRWFAYKLG